MTKGAMRYIPKEFLEELEDTKFQFKITKDADCFRMIAKNNRLAKELRYNLDYNIKRLKK